MKYIIDSETLTLLWEALNKTPAFPKLHRAQHLFQRLVKRGWVYSSDIEDIIDLLDIRLSTNDFKVAEFAKAIGLRLETAYYRPKAKSINVSGYEAFRVEDATLLLIIMERIGFQIDASGLVQLLLPGIKSRKKMMFSEAELDIFWFEKFRHKHPMISLVTSNRSALDEMTKTLVTDKGYKIELEANVHGEATCIKITAPKFRRVKEPVRTVCKDCGLEWYRGDPDSSLNHRREHQRLMAYLAPKPLPEFIRELKTSVAPELVTSQSPTWKHREIYERALAFKREMRFDFIQWQSPTGDDDPNVHGFLFANKSGAIIGSCSFRAEVVDGSVKFWKLDWVWVCPRERRNGHLKTRWEMFKTRFGNFVVTHPVSDDMKGFLKNNGDLALLNYPSSTN